ncbi:MAG TPA: phosphohistidine phosphatase SixA [Candidatus Acidoferrales bacterium]|nr:phosphohistidine phosphatase SixA [Candidatus Acidoferrales bacterium]
MLLYLMRHGVAVNRADPACPPEAERPLTRKGIKKTRAAAQGLRALGIQPDAMLTSPYLRAVQTGEIASEALGFPRAKLRLTDSLKPGSNPADLWKELARLRGKEVMCFGHAPHLDQVIAHAFGASSFITALKKAGVACLELRALLPPKGHLVWLHTPQVLRLLGE